VPTTGGRSGCLGTALVLPGASDQDGQGLHCAGVLGGCHRDRLDAGHLDSGLRGAGALGGGPGPSAGCGRTAAVRSELACRPEPGRWTLFLAAAVKLNRGRSWVAIAVVWDLCWWSWHGVAPRAPPNIADSREIRIQGPFLTPARFPHRRNRDSRGCFHTRAELVCPEPLAASPAGTHDAAGGPSACQVRWLVRAAGCGCWRRLGQAGCSVQRGLARGWARRPMPRTRLRTWLRSSTACWLPTRAGGSRPVCSDVPVAGEVSIRDLRGTLGPRQGIAAGSWRIGPASHGAAADRPGQQSGDRCHLLVGPRRWSPVGAPLQVGMLPSASVNGKAHSRAVATSPVSSPASSPGSYPYSC
jgi:hypothetical protein